MSYIFHICLICLMSYLYFIFHIYVYRHIFYMSYLYLNFSYFISIFESYKEGSASAEGVSSRGIPV